MSLEKRIETCTYTKETLYFKGVKQTQDTIGNCFVFPGFTIYYKLIGAPFYNYNGYDDYVSFYETSVIFNGCNVPEKESVKKDYCKKAYSLNNLLEQTFDFAISLLQSKIDALNIEAEKLSSYVKQCKELGIKP